MGSPDKKVEQIEKIQSQFGRAAEITTHLKDNALQALGLEDKFKRSANYISNIGDYAGQLIEAYRDACLSFVKTSSVEDSIQSRISDLESTLSTYKKLATQQLRKDLLSILDLEHRDQKIQLVQRSLEKISTMLVKVRAGLDRLTGNTIDDNMSTGSWKTLSTPLEETVDTAVSPSLSGLQDPDTGRRLSTETGTGSLPIPEEATSTPVRRKKRPGGYHPIVKSSR